MLPSLFPADDKETMNVMSSTDPGESAFHKQGDRLNNAALMDSKQQGDIGVSSPGMI